MKVVHVVGTSPYGGGSKVVLDLVRGQLSSGCEVGLVVNDPRFETEASRAGAKVLRVPMARRPAVSDPIALIRLWWLLRRIAPDVVHTHTSKGGVMGRVSAKLARVPLIVHTVHGFAFHEESRSALVQIYSWIERLMARVSGAVVTVSEVHRSMAIERVGLPADKVFAIPNGVAAPGDAGRPSKVDARLRIQQEFPQLVDVELIFTSARIAPQKGLDLLLRAAAQLQASADVTPFCIVIAGEGEEAESLRRLASALELDTVVFVGFRNDVDVWLRACDVYVLPSLREGLSISLLEAMAAGCFVVASSIPSNCEALDDAGVLVDPGSTQALFTALAEAIHLPPTARHEVGDMARKRIERHYTSSRMVGQYDALYRLLLPGHWRQG